MTNEEKIDILNKLFNLKFITFIKWQQYNQYFFKTNNGFINLCIYADKSISIVTSNKSILDDSINVISSSNILFILNDDRDSCYNPFCISFAFVEDLKNINI